MASLFKLRRAEPNRVRPFSAQQVFPLFPAFALGAAVICLMTMVYFNPIVAGLFVGLGVVGYLYFLTTASRRGAALQASVAAAAA